MRANCWTHGLGDLALYIALPRASKKIRRSPPATLQAWRDDTPMGAQVNDKLWVDSGFMPCFYRLTMTQTDSESMETDPRAAALLRKIEAFFAARERAGSPMSEYRFGIEVRYSTLLDRLRAGSGVGFNVEQRVEKFLKANAPRGRGRK